MTVKINETHLVERHSPHKKLHQLAISTKGRNLCSNNTPLLLGKDFSLSASQQTGIRNGIGSWVAG